MPAGNRQGEMDCHDAGSMIRGTGERLALIDDPTRFTSSKRAGPLFGLTPKKHQSGETDYFGRISKNGDASVREALYEAAHIILTKPIKGCGSSRAGRCGSPGAPA
jgi:transposase